MINITKIEFFSAEGPNRWVDEKIFPMEFYSFSDANKKIVELQRELPSSSSGTWKLDFQVEWADKQIYEGTYPMNWSKLNPDLGAHITIMISNFIARTTTRVEREYFDDFAKKYVRRDL